MTKTYIDQEGLVNVSEGIIRQARRDFIKGGKQLYARFGRIPTEKENLELRGPQSQDIRMTYDAWRFVEKDPYDMFGSVGTNAIIAQWTLLTIIDYYRKPYIDGAVELILNNPNRKELYLLDDEMVKSVIENDSIYNMFIKARNYIFSINRKDLLEEWAKTAYERVRKIKKSGKKINKGDNIKEIAQEHKSKKQKRIKEAKHLWDLGLTREEIAEKLGVTRQSVNKYLRS